MAFSSLDKNLDGSTTALTNVSFSFCISYLIAFATSTDRRCSLSEDEEPLFFSLLRRRPPADRLDDDRSWGGASSCSSPAALASWSTRREKRSWSEALLTSSWRAALLESHSFERTKRAALEGVDAVEHAQIDSSSWRTAPRIVFRRGPPMVRSLVAASAASKRSRKGRKSFNFRRHQLTSPSTSPVSSCNFSNCVNACSRRSTRPPTTGVRRDVSTEIA
mmetsp:Transcript_3104/g.10233  ORF Transcript_3104/g.10233 Transcript_3104/m.10233 type:complete len:220 (+) Transcript_3104:2042-2701(+)